jgi:hypothetical protein
MAEGPAPSIRNFITFIELTSAGLEYSPIPWHGPQKYDFEGIRKPPAEQSGSLIKSA